jgi:heme o synthase
VGGRATVVRQPIPGGEGPRGALLPARRRAPGHPVTAISERPAVRARTLSSVRAYVALTKPRIIELLLVTTLPAMLLAAGGWPSTGLVVATLVGGTMAAGAANVFNCYVDRDIDQLMHRTENRPLPTGAITPRAALVFGIVLTVVSITLLALTTTPLAAALAAGAIFYYAVLYTMVFKRHTRRSTEFGGIPGAAPVLIGWAAVTGSLAWPAWVFFGVVFCWQMPHFWALAMRFRADYARADVPMLPVVTTARSVGRQMVAWSWATVAVSLLLWPVAADYGIAWLYTALAAGLGAWFIAETHKLNGRIKQDVETRPMQLFHVSIYYMAALSAAIVLDVLV